MKTATISAEKKITNINIPKESAAFLFRYKTHKGQSAGTHLVFLGTGLEKCCLPGVGQAAALIGAHHTFQMQIILVAH